jgi:hypothetical protein
MKTIYYILGLAGIVVGTDYALRKYNYGKGLFTSTKYMAEFVRQNGLNVPSAQTPQAFYDFFSKLDKGFQSAWFKAAYRNTKENFPTFKYDGGQYNTKGGKKIA